MKKLEIFLILLIILGAFAVRLYRFDNPIADWHSWRQADTSAVSRNFIKYGFDLLHPRFDDLSNVASGLDNPMGYRFVEFPIYNVFQAGLFELFGRFTLEEWGRLVTIFSSCLSIIFIYLLIKKRRNMVTALLGAVFFAFIPFSIYYGRTILPDESMATAILGGIYFFDLMIQEKFQNKDFKFQMYFILAVLFTAFSFLLKPYALFFTLPMFYLAYERFGFSFLKKWRLWLFLVLSIIPLAAWRIWMLQYPQGIPASAWLFNGGDIRFKGAFFYWLFADRIGRLILGYWGLPLLVFGILAASSYKNKGFFFSFLASSLLYLFVIARGNVQHDYYQILIVPTIAIFLGLGADFLLRPPKEFNRALCFLLFIICSLFMFSFGWYFVRSYFDINNPSIIVAGEAVNNLTPVNAKIIAPYNGDTSFLYQTKRQGWASFERPLPRMIKMGADYLVLVNPTKKDLEIGKTYKIVSKTAQYILFNLRQKP
ncbi:glycosyltransferase family 39 protein [Patescibacteria group bacterium]|nr:glycosyltransferase family 39 protein [Patescibacteria group bacterium]